MITGHDIGSWSLDDFPPVTGVFKHSPPEPDDTRVVHLPEDARVLVFYSESCAFLHARLEKVRGQEFGVMCDMLGLIAW